MNALADVLARARTQAGRNNKDRPVKPPKGKSVWRILPGWRPAEPHEFFHQYGQHFIKDGKGKIRAVVTCPAKTYGKTCEICDVVADAIADTRDDATRDQIRESRASNGFLLNAIMVAGPGADKDKVVILQLPAGVFGMLVEVMEENSNLLDPNSGQDIIIDRTGEGVTSTKYMVQARSADKSSKVLKSHLMARHDLDEYVKEDFETSKKKALEAFGAAFDLLPASTSAGALTGPTTRTVSEDLGGDYIPQLQTKLDDATLDSIDEAEEVVADDDISNLPGIALEEPKTAAAAKPAAAAAPAAIDAAFNADVNDDDIEAMLANL